MTGPPTRLGPYALSQSETASVLRRASWGSPLERTYLGALGLLVAVGPVGAALSRDGAYIVGGTLLVGALVVFLGLLLELERAPYGDVLVRCRRAFTIEEPNPAGYRDAPPEATLSVDGRRFPLESVSTVGLSRRYLGKKGRRSEWTVYVVLESAAIEMLHTQRGDEAEALAEGLADLLGCQRRELEPPSVTSDRLFAVVGRAAVELVALVAFVLANLDVQSRSLFVLVPALWAVAFAALHWATSRLAGDWIRGDSDWRVRLEFELHQPASDAPRSP